MGRGFEPHPPHQGSIFWTALHARRSGRIGEVTRVADDEEGASLTHVRTSDPVAILTFDDGPAVGPARGTGSGTEAILRTLEEQQATATFFVLLTRVRAHPDLLREVYSAGHDIGLHGPDHRRLPIPHEGRSALALRLADARAELEDAVGAAVTWFRPPYGGQSTESWAATREAGLTPVLWSHTSRDWQQEMSVEQRLVELDTVGPGSIILAHDGYAGPGDLVDDGPPPRLDRGAYLNAVLDRLERRGLAAISLSTALTRGAAGMRVWLDQPLGPELGGG